MTDVYVDVYMCSVKLSGLINIDGTRMGSAYARVFWDRDDERRMSEYDRTYLLVIFSRSLVSFLENLELLKSFPECSRKFEGAPFSRKFSGRFLENFFDLRTNWCNKISQFKPPTRTIVVLTSFLLSLSTLLLLLCLLVILVLPLRPLLYLSLRLLLLHRFLAFLLHLLLHLRALLRPLRPPMIILCLWNKVWKSV